MQNTNTFPAELHRWVVDWAMIGSVVMIVFLLAILSALVLAIYGTFISAMTFSAETAPKWILVCWLVPIVGPLATLKAANRFKKLETKP